MARSRARGRGNEQRSGKDQRQAHGDLQGSDVSTNAQGACGFHAAPLDTALPKISAIRRMGPGNHPLRSPAVPLALAGHRRDRGAHRAVFRPLQHDRGHASGGAGCAARAARARSTATRSWSRVTPSASSASTRRRAAGLPRPQRHFVTAAPRRRARPHPDDRQPVRHSARRSITIGTNAMSRAARWRAAISATRWCAPVTRSISTRRARPLASPSARRATPSRPLAGQFDDPAEWRRRNNQR